MSKILNVTFYKDNYGSVLQAFALNKKLENIGHEPYVVVHSPTKTNTNIILRVIKFVFYREKNYSLLQRIKRRNQYKIFQSRRKKILSFGSNNLRFVSIEEAAQLASDSEVILLSGSDQVWNTLNGPIDPFYLFDFIKNENKYSYAASIGVGELNENQIKYYETNLNDYRVVSVRESVAYDIFSKSNLKNVRQDIDPTLLFPGDWWDKIASKRLIQKNYIFVYMLRPDDSLVTMAKQIKKDSEDIIFIGNFLSNDKNVVEITDASVEDFLSYILYADKIITNSFHGTVFSILFHKQFITKKISSTSSRVENLLNIVGLENRLINDETCIDIIDIEIDYDYVDNRLMVEQSKSIKYLETFVNE